MSASFTLEVQNVLEMLDLLLELCDEGVVSRIYLVLTDFGHDLFSPVGKLEG